MVSAQVYIYGEVIAMEQKSMTALVSAFSRGYHAAHNETKIFDDFLADQILTEEENR
jgi:hypothetical protein